MRRSLAVVLLGFLSGCAMTPEQLASTPSGSLCVKYATAILNGNRDKWLEEVYRRGETCEPYAREMEIAAAQSQASLNALNARYVYPAPQQPRQPLARQGTVSAEPRAKGATVVGFFRRSSTSGGMLHCHYDVLGRHHIISIKPHENCQPLIEVSM